MPVSTRSYLAQLLVLCFPTAAQTYIISTLAGGAQTRDVPATSTALPGVRDVAVDPAGNVFFTIQGGVMRLDTKAGTLRQIAGNGTFGFSGDNGPATEAQLNSPQGVAVDATGNVYIADLGNFRIRKVSAANGMISTIAGSKVGSPLGDNGPATKAFVHSPRGVAVDSQGNVFIADTGHHRIRKVSVSDGLIVTVAGDGTSGFSGDNGPAISARLNSPASVAVDASGNLYVADTGNGRIRKVSTSGLITTVAANLDGPKGLSVDGTGNLCVGSSVGHAVVSIRGGLSTVLGGEGVKHGDNGPAKDAQFHDPSCAFADATGSYYVADVGSQSIRKISSDGIVRTVAGGRSASDATVSSVPVSGSMVNPVAIAVNESGELHMVTEDGSIHKVSGGKLLPVAGGTKFPGPIDLAFDRDGNIYVATRSDVRRLSPGGVVTKVAGGGESRADHVPATSVDLGPLSIAVDASKNVYILEGRERPRIRKVAPDGTISTIAGGGASEAGNVSVAEASLGAGQIALDPAGRLLLVEMFAGRVRRMEDGRFVTIAGNGSNGFSGDLGPATAAGLFMPWDMALDSAGNLYIADTFNKRIRKVSNGVISTIAGNGSEEFSGDNGPALQAAIGGVFSIAVDPAGNVYLADTVNHRIRVLKPQPSASMAMPK